MSRRTDEAVEVLREIWAAGGQSAADLEDAFGTARSCKSMQAVGFDDPEDLRAAWRATLAREGKLSSTGTVRDLVLGSSRDAHDAHDAHDAGDADDAGDRGDRDPAVGR